MPNAVPPAPPATRGARASRASRVAVHASAAIALAACASAGPGPTPAAPPASAPRGETTRVEMPGGFAAYEVRTTADDRAVEATFRATTDRLWSVLPSVYDSLGIRLTTMNTAGRTLGMQNSRLRRRLGGEAMSRSLSCGTGITGEDNADSYDVFVTVMSAVEPSGGDRAVLRTWVQANARATGTSGNPVRCGSSGWLERRIAELAAARLGG